MQHRSVKTEPLSTAASSEPAGNILAAFAGGNLFDVLVVRNPNAVLVLHCTSTDPSECPVLYANDAFTRMTGFCLEDFARGECAVVEQIYALPTAKTRAEQAILNNKPDLIDSMVRSKDGAKLVFNSTIIPIAEEGGTHRFVLLDMQDITSFKLAAEHGASIGADLRTILSSASCLLWHAVVIDHGGPMSWDINVHDEEASRRWLPIHVPEGERFFHAVTRLVHLDDLARIDGNAEKSLRAGVASYNQEYRVKLETGEWRWLSEDVRIEKVTSNRWHLIGVVTDVTALKKAEERLADERNLLRTVIDNIPDGIYYKDTDGRFLINNSVHTKMLGRVSPEQVAGRTDFDFFPCDAAMRVQEQELAVMQSGMPLVNNEEPLILPDGRHVWHANTKVPLRDASGTVIGLVGITRDVTERKHLESERERLLADAIDRADRDPLTGLWNHRAFQKRLKDEADLAKHRGTSVAVIVLDMDNFKFFNDSYGHPVGDEVLCLVAQALRNACRSEDTVSRFGGDEFAILMPMADAYGAKERARQIVDTLNDLGYRPQGHASVVPVRLSFGLALFPDEASSRLDALAMADDRLLMAKSGINEASAMAERITSELASDPGFSMLRALVQSVDKKDRYTRHHSEDVLLYATQIAREIGLSEEQIREIQVSALLHDVGKIGVQDNILRKPSGLTAIEFEAIKKHPTMGAILVGSVPGFESALPSVKHHHERWDGKGYPDGLAGEAIPLQARLMAVADAYSAMTSDRPYRKSMSTERALDILREGSGTQWDPALVTAFIASRTAQPG